MVNSRSKGARGERELANWLKERGIEARRGQQYSGGTDSPDVVHSIEGVHIECKRVERFSLYPALSQAQFDAMGQAIPTVFHRKNNREWVTILDSERFLELCEMAGLVTMAKD